MPTAPTPIDALPTTPNPDDTAGFDGDAYTWSSTLPTFRTQTNDAATNVYNNAVEAADSATTATTKAAAAATSEANAADSANSALNAPGTNGTSTTALTIATGPTTLTTQTGKAWAVGQPVRAARTSDPSGTWMYGDITAYDSGTGSLTVNVKATNGAGTFTDWTIALSGAGVTPDGAETLTNKKLTDPTLADSSLQRAMLQDCGLKVGNAKGAAGGAQAFDYTAGSVGSITPNAATTISIINWPPTGNRGVMAIKIDGAGTQTLTLPTTNWRNPDGSTTTTFATYLTNAGITLGAQMNEFVWWTDDAGATLYGVVR